MDFYQCILLEGCTGRGMTSQFDLATVIFSAFLNISYQSLTVQKLFLEVALL